MKMYFLSFATLLLSSLLSGKVEVIEISPVNTSDLPGGKEADGIIGDFVLRNSNIEVGPLEAVLRTEKQTWVHFGAPME